MLNFWLNVFARRWVHTSIEQYTTAHSALGKCLSRAEYVWLPPVYATDWPPPVGPSALMRTAPESDLTTSLSPGTGTISSHTHGDSLAALARWVTVCRQAVGTQVKLAKAFDLSHRGIRQIVGVIVVFYCKNGHSILQFDNKRELGTVIPLNL